MSRIYVRSCPHPWFADSHTNCHYPCHLLATARLANFGRLSFDIEYDEQVTSFVFVSHGGHSHRQISLPKCELLEIGSTTRSIQAPSLDHHDIRSDVMEDEGGDKHGWESICRVFSLPTTIYKIVKYTPPSTSSNKQSSILPLYPKLLTSDILARMGYPETFEGFMVTDKKNWSDFKKQEVGTRSHDQSCQC